jgi:hypothetical protein
MAVSSYKREPYFPIICQLPISWDLLFFRFSYRPRMSVLFFQSRDGPHGPWILWIVFFPAPSYLSEVTFAMWYIKLILAQECLEMASCSHTLFNFPTNIALFHFMEFLQQLFKYLAFLLRFSLIICSCLNTVNVYYIC